MTNLDLSMGIMKEDICMEGRDTLIYEDLLL